VDACFPKSFSRFSRKIASGGYFNIKSTDFDAFMFLKDELNQKRGLWNMALKRFMNSCKHGKNHYVLAGPGDKGDDQLWQLTQIKGTKYFMIRCKGKYDGKATLFIPNAKSKNQYLFAKE